MVTASFGRKYRAATFQFTFKNIDDKQGPLNFEQLQHVSLGPKTI